MLFSIQTRELMQPQIFLLNFSYRKTTHFALQARECKILFKSVGSLFQLFLLTIWKVTVFTSRPEGTFFLLHRFCGVETANSANSNANLPVCLRAILTPIHLSFHRWSWTHLLSCSSSTSEYFTPTSNWRSRRVATSSGFLSASHRDRSPRYTTTYPSSREQINWATKRNAYIYLT